MEKFLDKNCENILNKILGAFFQMNSIADNMAYALDCELLCPIASKQFHISYAHAFVGDTFADRISNTMVQNNLRPVRLALVENVKSYEDIDELFTENYNEIDKLRKLIYNSIDELDYDASNKSIVVFLESILESLMPYHKQAAIWADKAKEYAKSNNVGKFDVHFEKFTFI